MARYVPEKGDFVSLTFDSQAGWEQRGPRPALVVSNTLFNRHTGLAMVCPITNTFRDIPFHVPVPDVSSLTGYGVPWKGTIPQRVRIPPGKLSLQPVAIGADDGGNDIV